MAKPKVSKKKPTLAQQLADAKLRYKLPDSKLTPELLAKRNEIKRTRKPAGPGSSMTIGDMEGLLKSQFGGAEAALGQRKTEIPQWFNDYRGRLSGLQTDQTNRSAALGTAITQLGANAAQNTKASNTDTNAQTAQANAVSGSTAVDPMVAARQQAAENVRQTGIGSYAGLAQQLGDNQQGFLQGAQTQSYGMENNAKSDLTKLFTDLQGKKAGAYQDILGQEQKTKLENAAFGLKSSDIKADNTLNQKKFDHDVSDDAAKNAIAAAKAAAAAAGKKDKDVFGNTSKQRRANQSDYKKAIITVQNAMAEKKPPRDWTELMDTLAFQYPKVDVDILEAAARKVRRGGKISPKLRKSLLRIGVTP